MLTTIEQTALSNLIHNEQYARKVLPFMKLKDEDKKSAAA